MCLLLGFAAIVFEILMRTISRGVEGRIVKTTIVVFYVIEGEIVWVEVTLDLLGRLRGEVNSITLSALQ